MTLSNEAMTKANEMWKKLAVYMELAEGSTNPLEEIRKIIAEALDESWNQGFSDCQMMTRIEAMRKAVQK